MKTKYIFFSVFFKYHFMPADPFNCYTLQPLNTALRADLHSALKSEPAACV